MILVTGGTGKVGSQLVEQLSAAKVPFKVVARTPAKVKNVAPDQVVQGAFEDAASIDKALTGVDTLFLLAVVGPNVGPDQKRTIDQAKAKGVKKVVRLSVHGADPKSPVGIARWHSEIDSYLQASGMGWTLLKPGGFTQNLFNNVPTIKKDGAFYGAVNPEGKITLIDARDIAAVAKKALTEAGHEGKAYELSGQEVLSNQVVADKLTALLGRPIKYVRVPDEAFKGALLGAGMPAYLADDMLAMAGWTNSGVGGTVDPTLAQLLGKTHGLDDFFSTYGGAFR